MASAAKTRFRIKAEARQWSEQRTPKSRWQFGLGLLLIAVAILVLLYFRPAYVFWVPIVGWAGALLAHITFPLPAAHTIFIGTLVLVVVICVAAAIWGTAKLVSASKTPVKTVRCPSCSTSFGVFLNVKKTMCPQCGQLALLGEKVPPELRIVRCGYCGLQTCATSDCGPFPCSNCAILRTGNDTPGLMETRPCPSCSSACPTEASFCVKCGNALRNVYLRGVFDAGLDVDWRIGKDVTGLTQFAFSILSSVQTRAEHEGDLKDLLTCLADMEMVILCIEQACQIDNAAASCRSLLDKLDETYGVVLSRILHFIESHPDMKYEKGALKVLLVQPYWTTRKSLEKRFPAEIPEKSRWTDSLINVKQTITGKYKIISFTTMKEDARRLQRVSVGT